MIDLTKMRLPSTVTVHGTLVPIRTNFRFALSALRMMKAEDYDRILPLMLQGELPRNAAEGEALRAVADFLAAHDELPRSSSGGNDDVTLLDYDIDSDRLVAAFWQCYGVRLTSPDCDLHWWEFTALVRGLTGTALNNVIELRCYKPGKNDSAEYKRAMLARRTAWEIRKAPTAQELADIAAFNALVK